MLQGYRSLCAAPTILGGWSEVTRLETKKYQRDKTGGIIEQRQQSLGPDPHPPWDTEAPDPQSWRQGLVGTQEFWATKSALFFQQLPCGAIRSQDKWANICGCLWGSWLTSWVSGERGMCPIPSCCPPAPSTRLGTLHTYYRYSSGHPFCIHFELPYHFSSSLFSHL